MPPNKVNNFYSNPEWPHGQGSFRMSRCKVNSLEGCTELYNARGAHGVLPMRVGGATSKLDLPSLALLSVVGCNEEFPFGLLQYITASS